MIVARSLKSLDIKHFRFIAISKRPIRGSYCLKKNKFIEKTINHQPTFRIIRKHKFNLLLRKNHSCLLDHYFDETKFFKLIRANPTAGLKIVFFSCNPHFKMIKINTVLNSRYPKQKWLSWTIVLMRFEILLKAGRRECEGKI